MNYEKRQSRKNDGDAVSPVVGVMLMLVVTIIVAAVVSGFSGGLIGNTDTAPTLTMDVSIVNTGTSAGSGFYATVLSASQKIPTKDLKLVTSWQTLIKDNSTAPNLIEGKVSSGGNTSSGNVENVYTYVGMQTESEIEAVAPFAMGPGIADASQGNTYGQNPTDPFGGGTDGRQWQWFGNYSLVSGTGLYAIPAPYLSGVAIGGMAGTINTTAGGYGTQAPYTYYSEGFYQWPDNTLDATQAVLGLGWENLRAGDVVSVKIIHVPSGKAIFQKDVAVTEG